MWESASNQKQDKRGFNIYYITVYSFISDVQEHLGTILFLGMEMGEDQRRRRP